MQLRPQYTTSLLVQVQKAQTNSVKDSSVLWLSSAKTHILMHYPASAGVCRVAHGCIVLENRSSLYRILNAGTSDVSWALSQFVEFVPLYIMIRRYVG